MKSIKILTTKNVVVLSENELKTIEILSGLTKADKMNWIISHTHYCSLYTSLFTFNNIEYQLEIERWYDSNVFRIDVISVTKKAEVIIKIRLPNESKIKDFFDLIDTKIEGSMPQTHHIYPLATDISCVSCGHYCYNLVAVGMLRCPSCLRYHSIKTLKI